MLKGLSSLVVRTLLLCLVATPAWAGSTIYMDSQTGDYIGGGQQFTLTDSEGTFSVLGKPSSGVVEITYHETGSTTSWSGDFIAPNGAAITVGQYDNAQYWPGNSPVVPGLNINNNGRSCSNSSGRFVVRDVEVDGNGNLTSFAADFQEQCGNSTGALLGAIRYNSSIPYPIDAPTADAGTNQTALQGTDVELDGSQSMPGNGNIIAYTWTQLSGPSVSLADPNAVSTVFMAPDVPVGGEDVMLQLEVDNSLGLSSTATVTIHVANPADPQTVLIAQSDSGDYIGQGLTYSVTPQQDLFTVSTATGNAVRVSVNGGSQSSWGLVFAPPSGQTLQVGTSYDMLKNYTGAVSAEPEMDIATSGRGCGTITGRFVILDLQTDGNGNITAFAADFVQHCEEAAPAVRGEIRFNSSVPLDEPWAEAGITQLVTQGVTVTLSSAGSVAGSDGETITSYQWTQLSGPTVTLSDPTAANPTFATPVVSAGGADLVFELTITSSDGLTSTDDVTVHVANTADTVTELQINSDPNDREGIGQNVFLNSLSSSFLVTKINSTIYNGSGVSITVNNNWAAWRLQLVMPVGQSLQTGTYSSGQAYPWENSNAPGFSVTYAGSLCITTEGQFTILGIQTDGSGNITSFAADFWETCDGGQSELRGKIRYNSSISIYDPIANAGQYQWVQEGDTATLTGVATDPGGQGVTVSSYQWTQLSGPSVTLSDATAEAPTFTAPNVPLGGTDLTFQLTVTNSLGLSATSAAVTVHVANPSDPAPFTALSTVSDAGDPVGGGQSATIDSSQATFALTHMGNNEVEVNIGQYTWDLQFAAPAGQALQAGVTYDLAQRYPFQGPISPGLSIEGPGIGCNTLAGRFAVLDVRYDKFGNIVSLAADFDQYCDGNAAGLHGMLRYNSGIAYSTPFADAGSTQSVLQGAAVTLDGSQSFAGSGETISTYQWTQLSGTSVMLSDATAAAPTFTAPDVPLGGVDLVFQLTVTNALGMNASDDIKVHVANPADPVTLLYLQSAPGEDIGQGITQTITPLMAAFTAGTMTGENGIGIQLDGGSAYEWTLSFTAPQGETLQTGGDYDSAQRYPFQGPVSPGLDVDGDGLGCNTVKGSFQVLDVQADGSGKITSFAADFTQYCDNDTVGLRGMIRYNSTVPLSQPAADPGPMQSVGEGTTVTLDGSQSVGGVGATISSYQWTQLSGPTVTLSSSSSAAPTFTSPDVPQGGATLVFQLTVTNSLGESTTQDVTVHVVNPSDPATGMYLQSRTSTGASALQTLYSPLVGAFTATTNASQGLLTVAYDSGSDWLSLLFRGPGGQPLQMGIYPVTGYIYPLSTSAPGFEASGSITGCQTVNAGEFDVLQVAYDGSGNVTQFAADFTVYCDSSPYALHGKIRYNSTVTILTPTADTGRTQYSYTGLTVKLDGSASTPSSGTAGYLWTQVKNSGDPTVIFSDPTAANPSFVAPAVLAGGRTLTFKLTVTNSADLSDSATTQVIVGNQSDPKTLFAFTSDPGDPIGNGASVMFTSHDGDFYNNFLGTDHVYLSFDGYPSPAYYSLSFYGHAGQPIQPGVYVAGPNRAPFTFPVIDISGGTSYCGQMEGVFVLREASFDTESNLKTAAVDFVAHCLGSTGIMRGVLRFNSKVPISFDQPIAYAGPRQQVTSPGAVNLDGYGSYLGMEGSYSYQWQQVSGPRVTLSNPGTPLATFGVTDRMLEGAGTNFVFRLTVTSSIGGSSTSEVTVNAALPTTNMLSLRSYAGDPVGNGKSILLKPADSAIQATVLGRDSLGIRLLDGSGWTLDFAAPAGQKLQAGTYSDAVLYSGMAKRLPGLFVGTKPGQCKAVRGSFTVRDVVYARNGTPDVLAVDFVQYCNGSSAPLYGEIRYHSTLP